MRMRMRMKMKMKMKNQVVCLVRSNPAHLALIPRTCHNAKPNTPPWVHDMVCALQLKRRYGDAETRWHPIFRVLKHPATFNQPLRGYWSPRSGYAKVAGRFNARISPGKIPASRSDA